MTTLNGKLNDPQYDSIQEPLGSTAVRVAGIAALIVMKAHALQGGTKPRDAYDLNFCLENFPEASPHSPRNLRRGWRIPQWETC